MSHRDVREQTVSGYAPAKQIVERYGRLEVSDHPLFVAMRENPVDMEALWLLMANLREGISRDFVVWLALTIAHVSDRRIGALLVKQLHDELGRGDFARIHSALLDRFVDALAPYSPAAVTPRLLEPGRRLLEEGGRPFYADQPYESVGALIVGEIFADKMDRCVGDEIRRQHALADEALTWLVIHEVLEGDHAGDSTLLAELVPSSGPELEAAWRGAESQWSALWSFLDRVWQVRRELQSGAWAKEAE